MAEEQWRPVVGYEGRYEVSDLGRVRRAGRLLQPIKNGRYVQHRLSRDGATTTRYAHHLVLEAFVGPRPVGMLACHGNGVATNNRLSNLRWDTPIQNARDKQRHGTELRGERHFGARLTALDVRAIRALRPTRTLREIAEQFGCSEGNISGICTRKYWRHV